MDPLISHHLERLKKRLHNSRLFISSVIENILEKLSEFESIGESLNDEEFKTEISKLFQEIQKLEPLKKVCQEHRDTYTHLSRVNKECEKYLNFNLEDLNTQNGEKLDREALNELISKYLLTQGMLSQACLVSKQDASQLEQVNKVFEAVHYLQMGNIDSALLSASEASLSNNSLLFHIHKLKYIELVKSGNIMLAIEYAQKNLSQYSKDHLDEINRLMGVFVFVNNPAGSIYEEILSDEYRKNVIKDILKEWTKASEYPSSEEIETLMAAAQQAIPQILPVAKVSGKIWTCPLPNEIKLSQNLKFHSTFVCPVSKEIATGNNPPIMLPCGHLIAKATMERLLSSNVRQKFKCPTCPTEVIEKDTKQIFI